MKSQLVVSGSGSAVCVVSEGWWTGDGLLMFGRHSFVTLQQHAPLPWTAVDIFVCAEFHQKVNCFLVTTGQGKLERSYSMGVSDIYVVPVPYTSLEDRSEACPGPDLDSCMQAGVSPWVAPQRISPKTQQHVHNVC